MFLCLKVLCVFAVSYDYLNTYVRKGDWVSDIICDLKNWHHEKN